MIIMRNASLRQDFTKKVCSMAMALKCRESTISKKREGITEELEMDYFM